MGRKKTEDSDEYRRIGDTLIQCLECKSFLRGGHAHFIRHKRTHTKSKKKYRCPTCDKLYSQLGYAKKHCRAIHNQEIDSFETITIPEITVDKPVEWIPPFEARTKPKFRTVSAPLFKKWDPEINKMLKEMIRLPKLIDPLPPDAYITEDDHTPTTPPEPYDPMYNWKLNSLPSKSESNSTICLDEKQNSEDIQVFIYSVYGIFQ